LKGVDQFNGIQRLGSTQLNTFQCQPLPQKLRPHKWLIFDLVRAISGIFSHDTYPASDGESGCREKICGVQQTPPVK
jgi:hypothetical protein